MTDRTKAAAATFLSMGLAVGVGATVATGSITRVAYESLNAPIRDTFQSLSGANAEIEFQPGLFMRSYDAALRGQGVSIGERFSGLTLTTAQPDFDGLTGTPAGPLSLQLGSPGRNLGSGNDSFEFENDEVVFGFGRRGFPNEEGAAEGAVSLLFDMDQAEFGLAINGGNNPDPFFGGGGVTLQFFRRDGSLIESVFLSEVERLQTFGFVREGGIADIAGISITNTDFGGVGYDDFRYGAVPTPGGMVVLVMAGLVAARRRR